jgi:hypothetical protein
VAAIEGDGDLDMSVTGSSFSSCWIGIEARGGSSDFANNLVVTDSTFEGCDIGIWASTFRFTFGTFPIGLTVTASEFIDNRVGIYLGYAQGFITDVDMIDDEATTLTSETGIAVCSGDLTAANVTITDHDVGVWAEGCGGEFDASVQIELEGMLVERGRYGIATGGFTDDGHFILSGSTVRDQTAAAVSLGMVDVAYMTLTGGNQLSFLSGFALEDVREDPVGGIYVDATGILLNGNSYTGLVEGPVSVPPDYRVVSSSGGIQF